MTEKICKTCIYWQSHMAVMRVDAVDEHGDYEVMWVGHCRCHFNIPTHVSTAEVGLPSLRYVLINNGLTAEDYSCAEWTNREKEISHDEWMNELRKKNHI